MPVEPRKPFRIFSIIWRYPLLSLAIAQYFDVGSTYLDYLSGHGREANTLILYTGGIFNPLNITIKLIIVPFSLIAIHKINPSLSSWNKRFLNAILGFYIGITINNLLGIFL